MTKPVEMTIREFLEAVANTEEIKTNFKHLAEFAEYRMAVMDKQNEKRKKGSNSKTAENLEIYETTIQPILSEATEPMTVKAIRETLTDANMLTSSKLTAVLKVAEKQGLVEQVQPEKKSHPMRYAEKIKK